MKTKNKTRSNPHQRRRIQQVTRSCPPAWKPEEMQTHRGPPSEKPPQHQDQSQSRSQMNHSHGTQVSGGHWGAPRGCTSSPSLHCSSNMQKYHTSRSLNPFKLWISPPNSKNPRDDWGDEFRDLKTEKWLRTAVETGLRGNGIDPRGKRGRRLGIV